MRYDCGSHVQVSGDMQSLVAGGLGQASHLSTIFDTDCRCKRILNSVFILRSLAHTLVHISPEVTPNPTVSHKTIFIHPPRLKTPDTKFFMSLLKMSMMIAFSEELARKKQNPRYSRKIFISSSFSEETYLFIENDRYGV